MRHKQACARASDAKASQSGAEPRPCAPDRRPAAGRRLRRTAILSLLLAALFCAFVWLLAKRAGPEFYGRPEALLPPGTAMTASCRDLSGLLREFESLNAVAALRRDEDLAALLLSNAAWRKIEREKDKARYVLLRGMARDFVDAWFGREVSLAVLPPSACASRPASGSTGLLVIARTDFGFEENLAELVAHYYPELALERRDYRGHALYRYNAENARRAFSYCRFGKTVVVSLRSAEWTWLEAAVDRRIGRDEAGNPLPVLSDEPRMRAAAEWGYAARGVSVCVDPRTLAEAARCFPGKALGSAAWEFWIDYIDEALRDAQWGALRLGLDQDGLRLASFWKAPRASAAVASFESSGPSDGSDRSDESVLATRSASSTALLRLARFPKDTPFALWAESNALGSFAKDLLSRLRGAQKYRKKIASFEKDWREWTGSDLARDWIEPLGGSVGVGLTSLAGGALFPIPTAAGWWEAARANDAKRLGDLLTALGAPPNPGADAQARGLALPFGRLAFAADGSALVFDLNRGLAPPANPDAAKNGGGLASHPLLSGALKNEAGGVPTVCLFADFESGSRCLEQVRAAAMLWSKEARKNFATWETILAAARRLRALRLTATPGAEGVLFETVVFVQ